MDSILIHGNAKQTGSFNILIQSSDLIDQRDMLLFQCNSPTLWSTYWKDYAQFYIKYQTVEKMGENDSGVIVWPYQMGFCKCLLHVFVLSANG